MRNLYIFNKKALLTFLICFAAVTAMAQVSISVQIFPPYEYRLQDYASHPEKMQVIITNTSAVQRRLNVLAMVNSDVGIRVRPKAGYKRKSPIVINPGEVIMFNAAEISNLLDFSQMTYTGITEDKLNRQNGLPEGNYQVCMTAYDYDTGEALSGTDPVGCSNMISITNIEPPMILNPADGGSVSALTPQVFTISWNTPPGAPPTTQYRIRIAEIIGNRSPQDALLSQTEPYFFDRTVMSNSYVYTPGDPQLFADRKYALMVQAIDPAQSINFRNNGQSVVTTFTCQAPSFPMPSVAFGGGMLGGISFVTTAAPAPEANTQNVVTSVLPETAHIKGNVNWTLRDSEGGGPVGNRYPYGGQTVSIKLITTTYRIRGTAVGYLHSTHIDENLVTSAAESKSEETSILTTVKTDASGRFSATISNPAAIQANKFNVAYKNKQYMGASRNYPLTSYCTYTMVATVDDKRFEAQEVKVDMNGNAEEYEWNSILYANTFRLQPKILSNKNEPLDARYNSKAATVRIYRKSDFYTSNPLYKGEGYVQSGDEAAPEVLTDAGDRYTKIGTPDSEDGVFKGLFYNTGNDWFMVYVTAKGHRPYFARFNAPVADETDGSQTPVLTPEIKLGPEESVWQGNVRVFKTQFEETKVNALVSLKIPGEELKSIATDDKGNFKLPLGQNYQLSTTPLEYTVAVAGDPGAYQGAKGTVMISEPGLSSKSQITLISRKYGPGGRVTDDYSSPVAFAALTMASTRQQVFTDKDGRIPADFLSSRDNDTITLEASGYMKRIVPITYGTSLGDIILQPKYLYRLTVKNDQGEPVPEATLKLKKDNATANDAVYTAVSGQDGVAERRLTNNIFNSYSITLPAESHYAVLSGVIAAPKTISNGLPAVFDASLNAFVISWSATVSNTVTLSGKVLAGERPLAGVKIVVGTKGEVFTSTDENGEYTLLKKQGPDTIYAIASGYETNSRTQNFSAPVNSLNFTLKAAEVKSLWGIDIAVTSLKPEGNQFVLSGAFVNLPVNSTFVIDPKTTLPFSNVKLKYVSGKLVPVDDYIRTDVESIPVQVYGYLSGTIFPQMPTGNKNLSRRIYVTRAGTGTSETASVNGWVNVNFNAYNPKKYYSLTDYCVLQTEPGVTGQIKYYTVLGKNVSGPKSLYLTPNDSGLRLKIAKLMFDVDLDQPAVQADGFHFAGEFNLEDATGDAASIFAVKEVFIDKNLNKGAITLLSGGSGFGIEKDWRFNITEAAFNNSDNGFHCSGSLSINCPGLQSPLNVTVKNLIVDNESVGGGELTIADKSLDLKGTALFYPSAGSDWRITGSGNEPYSFRNSGDISLTQSKYVAVRIPLNDFSIGTSGEAYANAPLNLKVKFAGLAKINLEQLHYYFDSASGGIIAIKGDVEFDLTDHFKAQAGDFAFYKDKITVSKLGCKIEAGELAEAELKVEFVNEPDAWGFKGEGAIAIKEVASLGLGVTYIKGANGTTFGGSFMLGADKYKVPISTTGYAFTQVGGSFQYETGEKEWEFAINGTIEEMADPAITHLSADVSVSVTAGPVIKGAGAIKFAESFELLTGEICLDVPKKQLSLSIKPNINVIPGLSASASGYATLGYDGGAYLFAGITAKVNAFGILKADAATCIGLNYDAFNHQKEIPDFYAGLDTTFKYSGAPRFTGFNVKARGGYDFAWKRTFLDIGVASASGHYATHFLVDGTLRGDFASGALRARFNADWGMGLGVDLKVLGASVFALNGEVGFGAGFTGTLDYKQKYIALDASAYGYISFNWNEDGCANDSGFLYAQACIRPKINIGYDSRKSSPLSVNW